MIDIDAQISEVKRELRKRREVYPRLVKSQQLPQPKADYQIAAMEAVLATLEAVAHKRQMEMCG